MEGGGNNTSGKGVKEYSSVLVEGLPPGWFEQPGLVGEPVGEATKVSSLPVAWKASCSK